jgi:hypothetical protein
MRPEQTCAACGAPAARQGVLTDRTAGQIDVYACAACGEYWLVPSGDPDG